MSHHGHRDPDRADRSQAAPADRGRRTVTGHDGAGDRGAGQRTGRLGGACGPAAATAGTRGEAEYLELSLTKACAVGDVRDGLDAALPDGIDVIDVTEEAG